jgi:hypothetical protein
MNVRKIILAGFSAICLLSSVATSFAQVPAPVPALPDTERRTSYSLTASTCACSLGSNLALYGDFSDFQNWAALRARAETLSSHHAAADAAFLDAKSKLQRYQLEADPADDKARAKLESAVATCAVTRDGYDDALGEVQAKIADAEQKTAAEHARVQRKAAGEKLARNLDAVEQAELSGSSKPPCQPAGGDPLALREHRNEPLRRQLSVAGRDCGGLHAG